MNSAKPVKNCEMYFVDVDIIYELQTITKGCILPTWSPWRCVIKILLILAAFTLLRITCV